MIVYGDPEYSTTPAELLARVSSAKAACAASFDALRKRLIAAGELEQAISDAFTQGAPEIAAVSQLTDLCAQHFVSAFLDRGAGSQAAFTVGVERAAAALRGVRTPLTVKVPEGFAFYALFPEQFCESALRWSERHRAAKSKRVLVLGLRSIGTTLSAIVAATLKQLGWSPSRETVRPAGPPYARRIELPPVALCDFALVVDEGPGRSGSSMAAAAEALHCAGLSFDRITLLPAHAHGPGGDASASIRETWLRVEAITTALDGVRWHGRSLDDELAAETEKFCGSVVTETIDVSAGAWRRIAYADSFHWPAVAIPFERTKRLLRLRDGRAVLWKFTGLRELPAPLPPRPFASIRCIAPLATRLGFTAFPWIEGRRLSADELDTPLLHPLLQHVCAVAGPPLDNAQEAAQRLAHMLYWNAAKSLGTEAAERTRNLAGRVRDSSFAALPRYGDGRTHPFEFIRDAHGQLWKAGVGGRDCDHTIVGLQTVLWDFAAIAIEWNVPRELLLRLVAKFIAAETSPAVFTFHCAAYAAFRMGLFEMSRASAGDEGDAERLEDAVAFYRESLRALCCEASSSAPTGTASSRRAASAMRGPEPNACIT